MTGNGNVKAQEDNREEQVLQVVAAHREPLFSRISLFNAKRRHLLREIKNAMSSDRDHALAKYQHELNSMSESDREFFESFEDSMGTIPTSHRTAKSKLRTLDNHTLEMVLNTFGGEKFKGINSLLANYVEYPQSDLREALSYRRALKDVSALDAVILFSDVRRKFQFEDLSELEGNEHAQASAILTVALTLCQTVLHDNSIDTHMTLELADVITEYPHRADDIAQYMIERGLESWQINTPHLIQWLDTPSASLSSGVL